MRRDRPSRSRRGGRRRAGPLTLACALALAVPAGGDAQTPEALAGRCTDAGGDPAVCAAAAVAGRALTGQLGLLAGSGSELPGSATTLGTRLQGGPRLAFYGRAVVLDVGLPDVTDPTGQAERTFMTTALHAGVAAGLFDGFRLMPTVGGFLSTDIFAHASFLFLPASERLEGSSTAFTGGVRVGVLREGFTVPGVSVSVSKRFMGSVRYGAFAQEALVSVDPSITSWRATVGKDLFAVELLAGYGWDDYDGDVDITRVPDGPGVRYSVTGAVEGRRKVYFGSAAKTFGIVLTLSVEGGWATGFDPVSVYGGRHDASAGTPFGSFSARLVL